MYARSVLNCARSSVRRLSTAVQPQKLALVRYAFVDGMLEKRTPYRGEHLELLTKMSDDGACILGGAYAEPCDGSVVIFSSREKAEEFVRTDPYNTAGLVTSYEIRDYMAVVGSGLK